MELTELESSRFERAAQLGRARVASTYRGVLGDRSELYQATLSGGANMEFDGDGVEVEYFGAGDIVGGSPVKATR